MPNQYSQSKYKDDFGVIILSQNPLTFMMPTCDRACKNRACGLKYNILFDETYLNTEM